MESLKKVLSNYIVVSDHLADNIAKKALKCSFGTRAKLLAPGEDQDSLFFLVTGIIRNYYKTESKEWTSRFSQAGDFVLSIDNFLFNLPCNEYIETCTAVEIIKFSKKNYGELLAEFPILNVVARNISDEHLRLSNNRMYSWRMSPAAQRYRQFVKEYPNLYKHVQLQHIASYLDISPYYLSHIRKQYE